MNTSITTPDQPAPNPVWWQRLVRRKGHIGPMGLSVLTVLSVMPIVMAVARLLAFPGMWSPDLVGFDVLRHFGNILNMSFTLEWMPPANRNTIFYLLMLPTALLMPVMNLMKLNTAGLSWKICVRRWRGRYPCHFERSRKILNVAGRKIFCITRPRSEPVPVKTGGGEEFSFVCAIDQRFRFGTVFLMVFFLREFR